MCDFSGLTTGNYNGFTWQASWGKAAFLTDQTWCTDSALQSEGGCSQGLRSPLASHVLTWLHICICGPGTFISRIPRQELFPGSSAYNSLRGLETAELKDTFCQSEPVLLVFFSFFSLSPPLRSMKLQEPLAQGFLSNQLIYLTLDQCTFPWGKWNRRESVFSLV